MDVVVVHFNAPEALTECLAPLCRALQNAARQGDSNNLSALKEAIPFSVIVVDNDCLAPAKEARRTLEKIPGAGYIESSSNQGFGAASNAGARNGAAPYVLFLNPDCIINATGIQNLAKVLQNNPEVVAVGPRIQRPDGFPEISWANHPGFLWEARRRHLWKALAAEKSWAITRAEQLLRTPRDVEWLTAACLLVRRDAFEAAGGFDEAFFLYFEDADLGLRLGQHGLLRFDPSVLASHRGGASTEKQASGTLRHYRASQRRYYEKHRPLWERICLRLWRMVKP